MINRVIRKLTTAMCKECASTTKRSTLSMYGRCEPCWTKLMFKHMMEEEQLQAAKELRIEQYKEAARAMLPVVHNKIGFKH